MEMSMEINTHQQVRQLLLEVMQAVHLTLDRLATKELHPDDVDFRELADMVQSCIDELEAIV